MDNLEHLKLIKDFIAARKLANDHGFEIVHKDELFAMNAVCSAAHYARNRGLILPGDVCRMLDALNAIRLAIKKERDNARKEKPNEESSHTDQDLEERKPTPFRRNTEPK